MIRNRHAKYCIVPPYLLREVAKRGTERQRVWAWRTLMTSEQLRGHRRSIAALKRRRRKRAAEKCRFVYDAQHGDELPGRLVRREGDPPSDDPAVDEAYEGSGATYDFFSAVFERNSLDDRGMRLDSSVHYLEGYDNAFWDGRQMVYGDGDEDLPEDERLWNRFTSAVEVIGHELAHGVIQYEANFEYRFQSGALNESFADVFGSLVKQHALGQTADEADWLIGKGLFTPNVRGEAIRSMKEPGTAYDDPVLGSDPQPAHMDDYRELPFWDDNGGVHVNSGIPNRAFYLTAAAIGGRAWVKAGRIWYVALRDELRAGADFQDAAEATIRVAGALYKEGGREQEAVEAGWKRVGIRAGVPS